MLSQFLSFKRLAVNANILRIVCVIIANLQNSVAKRNLSYPFTVFSVEIIVIWYEVLRIISTESWSIFLKDTLHDKGMFFLSFGVLYPICQHMSFSLSVLLIKQTCTLVPDMDKKNLLHLLYLSCPKEVRDYFKLGSPSTYCTL